MATDRQVLGDFGEQSVAQHCSCPKCKRKNVLKLLPKDFKCADVICEFCGYLAQVKSTSVSDISKIPPQILGAAWAPQNERMQSGIYFPLFLVLVSKENSSFAIYYLAADLQQPEMFKPRKPLSSTAQRAGWTGFLYDLREFKSAFVQLIISN